jgi:hypothetical protein
MKRSKIFLGVTTALLAVAGVAAAKNWNHVLATGYYTGSNHHCTAASSQFYTVNSGSGNIATNGSGKQLYSVFRANAACSGNKVFTQLND